MIPLCFPKIGVNLWVHLQSRIQVEIKLLHPASTLESRIQVITLKGLINNTNDQSGSVDHNPSKNSR
ncbi:MAG: hypothetical protein P8X79_16230 [Reinekea sp.]